MINSEVIKANLINLCSGHSKAKDVLKRVNGKTSYQEIANSLKMHPTKVSGILSRAMHYGLLSKEGKFYRKTVDLRHIDIDKTLSGQSITISKGTSIRIKKVKKHVDTDSIKEEISKSLINNYQRIPHPFSGTITKFSKTALQKAASKLFEYLDQDIELPQLSALGLRFYESFATYYSCSRVQKAELINAFSNLIKCFEPYVKKVALIKTGNEKLGRSSLGKDTISAVVSFSSDIDKAQSDYWKDKPIHEACIRFVYPYRHKEAHEARDYPSYEMDKIIYYMLASMIFINLDY